MSKKLVFGSLLFIIVVVVGKGLLDDNRRAPLKDSSQIKWVPPQNETLSLIGKNTDCFFDQGPCKANLPDDHEIEVSIGPHPIQPNKDLQLEVKSKSQRFRPISVDLEGINLNMGFIRPEFVEQMANQFIAKTNLPLCDEKKMQWRALVILEDRDDVKRQKAIQFLFNSEEP